MTRQSERAKLKAEIAQLRLQLAMARFTLRGLRNRCPFCGAPCGRRPTCRAHSDLVEVRAT